MKLAKIVGIILVVLGALVILGSSLVDVLTGRAPGFGFKQIIGVAVGAIAAIVGLILLLTKKSS